MQLVCTAMYADSVIHNSSCSYFACVMQVNMREAECARSNLAEDLTRLRMELEKVRSCKQKVHAKTSTTASVRIYLGFAAHTSICRATMPNAMLAITPITLVSKCIGKDNMKINSFANSMGTVNGLDCACRSQQSVTAPIKPTSP